VNVLVRWRVIRAVLRGYVRRGWSHHQQHVNRRTPAPWNAGSGVYSATKAALEGLSQSLSRKVGALGIKVTIVAPGAFRTTLVRTIQSTEPTPVGELRGLGR